MGIRREQATAAEAAAGRPAAARVVGRLTGDLLGLDSGPLGCASGDLGTATAESDCAAGHLFQPADAGAGCSEASGSASQGCESQDETDALIIRDAPLDSGLDSRCSAHAQPRYEKQVRGAGRKRLLVRWMSALTAMVVLLMVGRNGHTGLWSGFPGHATSGLPGGADASAELLPVPEAVDQNAPGLSREPPAVQTFAAPAANASVPEAAQKPLPSKAVEVPLAEPPPGVVPSPAPTRVPAPAGAGSVLWPVSRTGVKCVTFSTLRRGQQYHYHSALLCQKQAIENGHAYFQFGGGDDHSCATVASCSSQALDLTWTLFSQDGSSSSESSPKQRSIANQSMSSIASPNASPGQPHYVISTEVDQESTPAPTPVGAPPRSPGSTDDGGEVVISWLTHQKERKCGIKFGQLPESRRHTGITLEECQKSAMTNGYTYIWYSSSQQCAMASSCRLTKARKWDVYKKVQKTWLVVRNANHTGDLLDGSGLGYTISGARAQAKAVGAIAFTQDLWRNHGNGTDGLFWFHSKVSKEDRKAKGELAHADGEQNLFYLHTVASSTSRNESIDPNATLLNQSRFKQKITVPPVSLHNLQASKNCLRFVHIPKTGGTSIERLSEAFYTKLYPKASKGNSSKKTHRKNPGMFRSRDDRHAHQAWSTSHQQLPKRPGRIHSSDDSHAQQAGPKPHPKTLPSYLARVDSSDDSHAQHAGPRAEQPPTYPARVDGSHGSHVRQTESNFHVTQRPRRASGKVCEDNSAGLRELAASNAHRGVGLDKQTCLEAAPLCTHPQWYGVVKALCCATCEQAASRGDSGHRNAGNGSVTNGSMGDVGNKSNSSVPASSPYPFELWAMAQGGNSKNLTAPTNFQCTNMQRASLWGFPRRHCCFQSGSSARLKSPNGCSWWHFPPAYDPVLIKSYLQCQTFCVVRHPVARLLSQWKWSAKRGHDTCTTENFEKWVRTKFDLYQKSRMRSDCHFIPMADYVISGGSGVKGVEEGIRTCDHILNFETMGEELAALMDHLNFRGFPKLGRTNAAGSCSRGIRGELTSKTENLIKQWYRADYEFFGYT